jgi:hypothetical protein
MSSAKSVASHFSGHTLLHSTKNGMAATLRSMGVMAWRHGDNT